MGHFWRTGATRSSRAAVALCAAAVAWTGCGGAPADVAGTPGGAPPPESGSAAGSGVAAARGADSTVRRARVAILGDSLTAGLGLAPEDAYPSRLQALVDAEGWPIEIAAMGVSGDTTAGGLRRLDWALDGDVRVLLVALGGNDALRGLPVDQMRDNLERIVEGALERGIRVVLAGMEAPPNFGVAYTSNFREVFRYLAQTHEVTFVPFLLEGVAGVADLNQADGIHPNEAGAARVARHLWPSLEPLLREIAAEEEIVP